MNHASLETGFTLLELMVAMALSVVIATISAMALSTGADFYARNNLRQALRGEFKVLESTLRPEWQLRVKSLKLTDRSIEFVTTQPRGNDLRSNVVRVNYECNLNEKLNYSLVHTSLEFSIPTEADGPTPTLIPQEQRQAQTTLLNNLKACRFSALVSHDSKARSQWVSQWGEDEPPPKLIRLQVGDFRSDLPNYVFVAETF